MNCAQVIYLVPILVQIIPAVVVRWWIRRDDAGVLWGAAISAVFWLVSFAILTERVDAPRQAVGAVAGAAAFVSFMVLRSRSSSPDNPVSDPPGMNQQAGAGATPSTIPVSVPSVQGEARQSKGRLVLKIVAGLVAAGLVLIRPEVLSVVLAVVIVLMVLIWICFLFSLGAEIAGPGGSKVEVVFWTLVIVAVIAVVGRSCGPAFDEDYDPSDNYRLRP